METKKKEKKKQSKRHPLDTHASPSLHFLVLAYVQYVRRRSKQGL
jgi:hypothetical protein